MFTFLKYHPFAVEAFFEFSLVLTYAVKKEELKDLIPSCLELDTHEDTWAFVAVAMVKTTSLRPHGFPAFMGNDFFLTGYRIFVRYTTSEGKRLRGLYILRSETDKKKMEILGNLFTHYKYHLTDIHIEENASDLNIRSHKSRLGVEVNWSDQQIDLPSGSPFESWKEARRFAGPLPFTFTYNSAKKEVLIIEGLRENWIPAPVNVIQSKVGFIEEMNLKEAVLANAFIIRNIPYSWKKGRIDTWKG